MQFSHTTAASRAAIPPSDVYVALDTKDLAQRLGALPAQLRLASKRAATKTRNWLMTQLRRELAQALAVPQKPLRGRFRRGKGSSYSEKAGMAVLWIGLSDIGAEQIGKPRQLKKGVKVKQYWFERAFVADIYGGQKVWRRKGTKRLPVIKMTVPINEEMEEILPRYEVPVARKFEEIFEHELKFAMGWFK